MKIIDYFEKSFMSKYSLTQRILEHREIKAISLIKDSIGNVNLKPKICRAKLSQLK